MRNTKNEAKLLGGNIKGRLFLFLYTSEEHYFEDRCTKFRIVVSYIQLIVLSIVYHSEVDFFK